MSQELLERSPSEVGTGRYMAVIFNNDTTDFYSVIVTLMAATDCSQEEAEIEAWEAHTFGRAAVHFDSKDECERVARLMKAIGVHAEVELEWKD